MMSEILKQFIEQIKNTAPIWQLFRESHQTSQAIKLSENSTLESLIIEIFVKKTFQVSEEKVAIYKEKKVCVVCKNEKVKFSYICDCGAIYCDNCALALSDLENACWISNLPIDYSKPVKIMNETIKSKEKDYKKI